jgi:hypothetical protein
VTTLTTPGGKPASSNSLANSRLDAGAYSDGLTTKVLPAARPGASFQAASRSGEFHAVIATHTPSGSRRVKLNIAGLSIGSTAPWSLSARTEKQR